MSLNGLDAPPVLDAYQTAVAESAGWFLLKYISRDAVELLARGKSGVVEARDAIKDYSDPSPLYGLIVYRRRKILIKYLPDGTSRLLQARTTVHFQTVLERYSPYETVLEISSADALNDTSLAASFQLHTAATSSSPSASRLDEIREDGEDSAPGAMRQAPSARTSSGNLSAAQRYKAERRIEQLKRKGELPEKPTSPALPRESALPQQPASPPPPPKSKPSMSQYLVHEAQGQTSITRLESPLSTRSTTEDGGSVASPRSEESTAMAANIPDSASQTTLDASESPKAISTPPSPEAVKQRPLRDVSPFDLELPGLPATLRLSLEKGVSGMADQPAKVPLDEDDPYDLKKYDEWFKPKVKLGPRPVNPSENKNRPMGPRVSALPANFKPAVKKQEPTRASSYVPKGPQAASAAPAAASTPTAAPLLASFKYAPPPVPDMPEYDPRPVSRGSVKSTPSHKSTMMTPDKLRLMKAIEHRKKQMRKSRDQASMKPPIPDDVPQVPEIPCQEGVLKSTTNVKAEPAISQTQSSKADSGIELHYEKAAQHEDQRDVEGPSHEPRTPHVEPGKPSALMSEDSTGQSVRPATSDDLEEKEEHPAEEASTGAQADAFSSSKDQPPKQADETTERSGSNTTVIPTIVMSDGSRPQTSDGQIRSFTEEDAAIGDVDEDRTILMDDEESTSETLEAPVSPKRQNSDLAKRRRGFVEPLHIEVSSGNPDDFASDDDEFFDELDSATVQEAKPIMVARSPLNATLPDRRPSADTVTSVRSVTISRQSDKAAAASESDSLEPTKSHSSSITITPPLEKNDSLAALSRNVSSGISKRIQLLAELSTREVGQSINLHARPLTPEYSPNAFIQQDHKGRKANVPRSRPASFRRHSSHRSAQSTATPTPTNENAPVWSVQHDPATNRNSVSVTARIVRPNVIDETNDEVESPDASLYERPDSAADELPDVNTTVSQSNVSSPAMSPVSSRFSAEIRTLHSATSRFGRHRQNSSTTNDEFPPPGAVDEAAVPKEGGRTNRWFKRISKIGGSKRKNGVQSASSNASITSITSVATVTGADENNASVNNDNTKKAAQRMSTADTPPAVVVGDLNVQFPDSLLWKRRIVTIDDAGNLQFAIAHAMEIHKGVAQKRYPLAEFRAPYAPDLDSQELAHSVVLELYDGTALQAACEDAMTQRQVLHLLRTYWKAYTT